MSLPNQLNATIEEINKVVYHADIHLNVSQPEPVIGDSTWRSPSTYVTVVDTPVNFEYVGGQVVYTGSVDIHRVLIATVTFKATLNATTIRVRAGKNGIPYVDYEMMHYLTNPAEAKELTVVIPMELQNGDAIDYFINADKDVIIEKAIWLMNR